MFFKRKQKIRFIEYKPEELEPRTEWLFWSLFIHLQSESENLKDVIGLDDYKWSFLKKDALFETLLWCIGSSLAVLHEKLKEKEREKMTQRFIVFLEIFFPNYKDYQIIDVLSNYIVFAEQTKDHKKLRENLEGYFIERIAKLFNLDIEKLEQDKIRDMIFMKFPHGWMLALDAFSTVTMRQVEKENQMARQKFQNVFTEAKERLKQEETDEEKKQREKWEKGVDEFNKVVGEAKDAIEYEIDRRQNVEKNLRKFLLQMNSEQPLEEQVLAWIRKEKLDLSDSDIEKLVDMAHSKYEELQSNQNREKFFGKN